MPAAADELWLVPIEGTPRKLAIDLRQWVEGGHVQLHPDGRHLAFVANAGQPGAEIGRSRTSCQLPAPAAKPRRRSDSTQSLPLTEA